MHNYGIMHEQTFKYDIKKKMKANLKMVGYA